MGLKLLEALLQPAQEGERRQRASGKEEEGGMAALDTHLVRSVMARSDPTTTVEPARSG